MFKEALKKSRAGAEPETKKRGTRPESFERIVSGFLASGSALVGRFSEVP